jgi:hypothetical protein
MSREQLCVGITVERRTLFVEVRAWMCLCRLAF